MSEPLGGDMDSGDREALWRAMAEAEMRHEGFTDAEIADESPVDHEGLGCELTCGGWDCVDENDKSRHPDDDRKREIAEMADAMLPAVLAALGQARMRRAAVVADLQDSGYMPYAV